MDAEFTVTDDCLECGGKCCLEVPWGLPPWSKGEGATKGKRPAGPAVPSRCSALTTDGLCSLHHTGKPRSCATRVMPGDINCRNAQKYYYKVNKVNHACC